MSTPSTSAVEQIVEFQTKLRSIFNGPPLAGIGATADKGLLPSRYHILPYEANVAKMLALKYVEATATNTAHWGIPSKASFEDLDVDVLIKYAKYNVSSVFGLDDHVRDVVAADPSVKPLILHDLLSIYILMAGCNLHYGECRGATPDEATAIMAISVSQEERDILISAEQINRAATFIMARAHTKYQTNHAVGGSPAQGAVGATIRWAYDISVLQSSNVTTTAKARTLTSALYWALHPLNEPATIPFVVEGSKITSASFHKAGPEPVIPVADEFFRIRRKVAPASAHNFGLCVAAMKHLAPLGILTHFPEQSRFTLLMNGYQLVDTYGARLHPAANFWGLERISANQKDIETLVQDLGYAVTRLFPLATLAKAPAFSRQDVVNTSWKTLIDALKAKLDESSDKLIDEDTFMAIQKQIAPPTEVTESLTNALAIVGSASVPKLKAEHRFIEARNVSTTKFEKLADEFHWIPNENATTIPDEVSCEEFNHATERYLAKSAIVCKAVIEKTGSFRLSSNEDPIAMPHFYANEPFARAERVPAKAAVEAVVDDDGNEVTAAEEATTEEFWTHEFNFFKGDIAYENDNNIKLSNSVILRRDGEGFLVDAIGNVYFEANL